MYLRDQEDDLKGYKDSIISQFEEILKGNSELKGYMLNGRVKKPTSLKEKIVRKINFFEDSNGDHCIFIDKLLDDIIGIRILCLLNEDEKKIYEFLKTYFTKALHIDSVEHLVNEEPPTMPYLAYAFEEQPVLQKNGKGIYKLKLKYIPNQDKFINVELQIKSLTHMFWGELEHMLFYKNYKYNLDHEFYSKMMLSVNSMLENLDSQLKDLKGHMSKNDKIKDTQNMVTKILYNGLHDKIKHIHDTELDLREIYTLISQLFFSECQDYQESLKIAQELFFKISQVQFTLPEFQFSELEDIEDLGDDLNSYIEEHTKIEFFNEETFVIFEEFAHKLDALSKGNDIFWCCMLAIHIKLSNKPEDGNDDLFNAYRLSLYKITLDFIKGYMSKYMDDIDLDRDEEKERNTLIFINNCILDSLKQSFCTYKKIDFFLEDIHQENIIRIIREFIEFYQGSFEGISLITEQEEKDQVKKVITSILKLQIQYYLTKKINKKNIEDLKENLEGIKHLDWDSSINTQNLDEILEGNTIITNQEELLNKIYFIAEEAK